MKLFTRQSKFEAFASELDGLVVGLPAQVRRGESQWSIEIGTNLVIMTYDWRLVGAKSIIVSSQDDGHQFGLPAPVDAETLANQALSDKLADRVTLNARTGDCEINVGGFLSMQILTSSMGYESWQLYRDGEFFAAVGNGGLI